MCFKIVDINELASICGYFNPAVSVNNGYGCDHPEQSQKEYDDETGKMQGKCYSWSCPIASQAMYEDLLKYDKDLVIGYTEDNYDPDEEEWMMVDCETYENLVNE